jgi:hypothetical protein
MKRLAKYAGAAAVVGSMLMTLGASAASFTLSPWTYDPGNTGTVVATTSPDSSLHLEKNAPTPTNAAAGAEIQGVSGLSTTGMVLSYEVSGYCGAGAPRFNVYLSDGSTVFLGCIYGNDGSGNVSFTAGNTYGGVLFPTGATVTGIDIVQDEQGQTTLSNIMVNGQAVTVMSQTLKDQCKNGGWKTMGFKNQGQCVSSFVRQNS